MLMFKEMRKKEARKKFHVLPKLFDDIKSGNLAQLSWVEPIYFDLPSMPASDQHPDHDVSVGEQLIKDVYEALRASDLFNSTLFIITYDEHGGFFDHVLPQTGVPNPDGLNSTDSPFDFTRLGIRIPTVFVSPLIEKSTILSAAPVGEPQYEHSSLISTIVHKIFQPQAASQVEPVAFLTARDAWARTFEAVISPDLLEPRSDCPKTLPVVISHREQFPQTLPPLDGLVKQNKTYI